MRHSLEVLRRIYDDEDGVYLEVGPDADSLDLVEVRSSGKFGDSQVRQQF